MIGDVSVRAIAEAMADASRAVADYDDRAFNPTGG